MKFSLPYETTILVNEPSILDEDNFDSTIAIIPIILIIGFAIFIFRRRKESGIINKLKISFKS